MFFEKKGKNRKTQEQLNEEFAKQSQESDEYDESDTEVTETMEEVVTPPKMVKMPTKPMPKPVTRPNISHSEQVSQPEDEGLPESIKKYAETFNEEFGKVAEPSNPLPDKQFAMLFAIYVEMKRTNRIMAGQNILLEDLIQTIKES